MHRILSLLLFLLFLQPTSASAADIFAANKALGRGVNLGNALEAPKEGDWGMTIKDDYFAIIKKAGFDSVRIPVKWSAHAQKTAPYTIDASFFARVDHLLGLAEASKLNVVLNIHHFDELDRDPEGNLDLFLALWKQIAGRYKNRGAFLYFELNNEPHGKLDDRKWNAILVRGLATVRETNPTRPVIVGPAFWNGIWALPKLTLPADDHLIVTVHMYNPFEFTHQGASWAEPKVRAIKDRPWNGTPAELAALRKELDQAATWGKKHHRPLFLGEFGSYEKAPLSSRVRWTRAIVQEAEARGFSWAYWEFGAGFGVYNRETNSWRQPLLDALLPPR